MYTIRIRKENEEGVLFRTFSNISIGQEVGGDIFGSGHKYYVELLEDDNIVASDSFMTPADESNVTIDSKDGEEFILTGELIPLAEEEGYCYFISTKDKEGGLWSSPDIKSSVTLDYSSQQIAIKPPKECYSYRIDVFPCRINIENNLVAEIYVDNYICSSEEWLVQ